MIAQVRCFPERGAKPPSPASRVWGIVLAGGAGTGDVWDDNTTPLAWRPRRSTTSPGPTRLARTIERVRRVIEPERLVAVFARDDAAAYNAELARLPRLHHVVQPRHRGSAAETFLPLLKIARVDPDAVVAVLPSDHLAGADGRVIETLSTAAAAAALRPDLAVLVGADSHRADATYGWVEPGDPVAGLETLAVRSVRRFVHDRPLRRGLAGDTPLLSTPAVVGKARTLLMLGRRYVPDVLETLEPLDGDLDAPEERLLCEAVYECMPYASVARELLERGDHCAVLPVPGALWRGCAPARGLLAS